MKIFILDDDDISNELSKIILNLAGINDIEYRGSGKEAIKYLDDCHEKGLFPDLILVDINLPGMSGFNFIEHYESNYMNLNPGTRLIMLTNSVSDEEKFRALTYNSVIDFWSKPLTFSQIDDILKTFGVKT